MDTKLNWIAVEKALQTRLGDARDQLVAKCVDIMAVYKSDLASKKDNTQLLLPEALKLLPLYVLSLIKVNFILFLFNTPSWSCIDAYTE